MPVYSTACHQLIIVSSIRFLGLTDAQDGIMRRVNKLVMHIRSLHFRLYKLG